MLGICMIGIYSVTDEYEQRVYGKISPDSDVEMDSDDAESDTESIEDAGLAPEFDVDLSPFAEDKLSIGEEDFGGKEVIMK